jgi:endo-1,4-beta-xylanase
MTRLIRHQPGPAAIQRRRPDPSRRPDQSRPETSPHRPETSPHRPETYRHRPAALAAFAATATAAALSVLAALPAAASTGARTSATTAARTSTTTAARTSTTTAARTSTTTTARTSARRGTGTGAPLWLLAAAHGKFFGTALTLPNLSDPPLLKVADAQFDMATPGNEMKWDTTEPSNGTFNFGPGDQIVAYAHAHHMVVRGHNLVWQSQLPSWVSSLPLDQVKAAMEKHITTEVSHYRGQVYSWDVVNEPLNGDGTFVNDVFYQAMGPSYIADALRTAHAADPHARLYLNDYNIEGINAKSDAMYNLVKSLKAQGVPIDAVGLESHFITGTVPSTMLANMRRFAALGVDVAVTELDDRMPLPPTSAELAQQAADYATVVRDCLAVRRCVSISQWGVGDADSWIPGFFPGYGAATMFDQNYQPKPAFYATQHVLASRWR